MKRKLTKISGIGLVLALLVSLLLVATLVSADSPITPPPGEHFTFNCVTGIPVEELGPNEILIPLIGSGMLGWVPGNTFEILDNDMTDGQAWVQVPTGTYITYDQVRGRPGGTLFWGNSHSRSTSRPVWVQHNGPSGYNFTGTGNWAFTNDGVTCYTFRLY